jgi:hypothetical protein
MGAMSGGLESPKQSKPFTTSIELSRLRVHLTSEEIKNLKTHLSEVYAKFIDRGAAISVNGEDLAGVDFDNQWSYPPKLFPVQFSASIPIDNRKVDVEITSGLLDHPGDPDNSYGVFLYCNGRLIARGLTDFSVGFSSGIIGNPHYNISLARTIVKLKGQSCDMPWDSSKSGINSKHQVYQVLRPSIIDATKKFAQISRSLQGKWESEVFPYKTGHIVSAKLDITTGIPKSYLPTPPASKQRWHQKVATVNAPVVAKKPWSAGLLDSAIAVDMLSKTPLSQKNRLCFILLDSAVEIAYKEYLVNEIGIGMDVFKKIAGNRTDVQKSVLKHLAIDADTVKKLNYYYKLRCDLIHERATPNITDDQIEGYRGIVEQILNNMFGLTFN